MIGLFRKKPARTEPTPEEIAVQEAVAASGLFDPDFYLHRNPEIAGFRKGPLAHFCQYGMNEHRDPGPNFNTGLYMRNVPESVEAGAVPFLHMLAGNAREEPELWLASDADSFRYLLERSGLFDPDWYLAGDPELVRAGFDPLTHLIDHGRREWRDPGPDFDAYFYAKSQGIERNADLGPLEHYLRIGRAAGCPPRDPADADASPEAAALREAVAASGLFDAAYYLDRYPELTPFRKGPLAHFCRYGMDERRDPGPNFDLRLFLKNHPEADTPDVPPFLHALAREHHDDPARWLARDAKSLRYLVERSGLFDGDWYLVRNPDLVRAGLDPLMHLLAHGMREWRDPGPDFDTDFYAERYPTFLELRLTPLEHFLRIGRAAGYAGKGGPRYQRWDARFNALTEADAARIAEAAAARPLPPVACLHVSEPGEAPDAIRADLAVQVGVSPALRILRAAGAGEAVEPAHALDGIEDGTLLVLSGGGARLRPHAAYVMAEALERFGAEAAYCDHDRLGDDGIPRRPVFKPAMSPEFMRRLPYAGPVAAIRLAAENRARIAAALADAGADAGAAWARLFLALPPARVARVPFPLFHLHDPDPEEPETDAVYEPVADAVPGPAAAPTPSGSDLQALPDAEWPEVRIVIPTRDRHELLEPCIDSIVSGTDYPRARLRVIVVDNDSDDPDSLAYLARLAERPDCAVVPSPGGFNFAKICNDGAAAAGGDVLVFLNNDTTVLRADWLKDLARHAIRPEVGAVGAQLLYPDDTVQHGGVIVGIQGVGGHRLVGVEAAAAARRDVTREMVAVTGACLAIRRDLFEALGGFDERLGVAFNDTVLCVRAHEAGYRNLYLAEPMLHHHESKSRGYDDSREKWVRNRREAIYVRERHGALFRDDPSYSPNLSLQNVGFLAKPPRIVRPWRRSRPGERRALLLSAVHGVGHGVAGVLAQQADCLIRRGWSVIVGGPTSTRDRTYPNCRRVAVWTSTDAAALAVEEGIDCVIAHTPPFFAVTRFLGRRPLVYLFDHGEPPPALFADRMVREDVDWEKRFVAPLARRTFAISQAIYDQQFRRDAVVLRNGNSHLATWSPDWAKRRAALRETFGFSGRFVVLTVCRFGEEERRYKGIDATIDLLADLPFLVPDLAGRGVFVLAGRGDRADVAHVEAGGLTAFANVTDAEMAELYAASDLYLSLSQWEGYNLGIGQALAMGLPVVASDIPAHREFGIATGATTARLCALIRDRYEAWDEAATGRVARIEPWETPLARMADLLEADCAEEDAGPWY